MVTTTPGNPVQLVRFAMLLGKSRGIRTKFVITPLHNLTSILLLSTICIYQDNKENRSSRNQRECGGCWSKPLTKQFASSGDNVEWTLSKHIDICFFSLASFRLPLFLKRRSLLQKLCGSIGVWIFTKMNHSYIRIWMATSEFLERYSDLRGMQTVPAPLLMSISIHSTASKMRM